MPIQPQEVKRSKYGQWTHKELPNFGENPQWSQIHDWARKNEIQVHIVWLEQDAPDSIREQYLDKQDPNFRDWNPTPPMREAFLLSVHDTDDGPCAWFAVPHKR